MLKVVNKKNVLSAVVAGLTTLGVMSAHASLPGLYVGGQLGYSDVHQGGFSSDNSLIDGLTSTSNKSSDTGFAGRAFGGYQFNQNLAAELGYTRFHNATASTSATDGFETFNANGTIKTEAYDLVAKAILPLQNCFSVYGKLGVAYLRASGSVKASDQVLGTTIASARVSENENKFLPTFGAGVSYDLTRNLSADVSWNHIQKVGSTKILNNTDFFGAGLAYNFG